MNPPIPAVSAHSLPTAIQVFWAEPWTSTPQSTLHQALESIGLMLVELPSQVIDLATGTVGDVPLPACAFHAAAGPKWSCLHYPASWAEAEQLAAAIAHQGKCPVLVLRETEDTEWGFSLHQAGQPIVRFTNLPTMHPHYADRAPLDPRTLSRAVQVPSEQFIGYLQLQSPDEVSTQRAYAGDEFALGDTWVRVDFLRAIGITYPTPALTSEGRYVRVLRPQTILQ